MTLAVPTHLVDTMSTATASGVEAAGHLLQEVSNAVSAAANGRARRLMRATGHGKSRSNLVRNLTLIGTLGAVAVIAWTFAKGCLTVAQGGNESQRWQPRHRPTLSPRKERNHGISSA